MYTMMDAPSDRDYREQFDAAEEMEEPPSAEDLYLDSDCHGDRGLDAEPEWIGPELPMRPAKRQRCGGSATPEAA